GAGMHPFENSFRKAWTARSFRAPSGTIEQRLKDNPNLPLIHLTNVIADKGGLPIKVGDDTIGGVGVSGCPGCDEPCSQAGIDKLADNSKKLPLKNGRNSRREGTSRAAFISASISIGLQSGHPPCTYFRSPSLFLPSLDRPWLKTLRLTLLTQIIRSGSIT